MTRRLEATFATLGELRQAYFAAQENRLETTTIAGIKLHFDHLERILGKDDPDVRVNAWVIAIRLRAGNRRASTMKPPIVCCGNWASEGRH